MNVRLFVTFRIKKKLRDNRFSSEYNIATAIHYHYEGILIEYYLGDFKKCKERIV